jgi:hypothetical protein
MGLVTGYDNDVFISYGHIDNQPFGDPGGGWVDIFHEHLQNFVNVHMGRRTKVWRDKRLTGAEIFSDEIEQQLRSSAGQICFHFLPPVNWVTTGLNSPKGKAGYLIPIMTRPFFIFMT